VRTRSRGTRVFEQSKAECESRHGKTLKSNVATHERQEGCSEDQRSCYQVGKGHPSYFLKDPFNTERDAKRFGESQLSLYVNL